MNHLKKKVSIFFLAFLAYLPLQASAFSPSLQSFGDYRVFGQMKFSQFMEESARTDFSPKSNHEKTRELNLKSNFDIDLIFYPLKARSYYLNYSYKKIFENKSQQFSGDVSSSESYSNRNINSHSFSFFVEESIFHDLSFAYYGLLARNYVLIKSNGADLSYELKEKSMQSEFLNEPSLTVTWNTKNQTSISSYFYKLHDPVYRENSRQSYHKLDSFSHHSYRIMHKINLLPQFAVFFKAWRYYYRYNDPWADYKKDGGSLALSYQTDFFDIDFSLAKIHKSFLLDSIKNSPCDRSSRFYGLSKKVYFCKRISDKLELEAGALLSFYKNLKLGFRYYKQFSQKIKSLDVDIDKQEFKLFFSYQIGEEAKSTKRVSSVFKSRIERLRNE